MVVYDTSKDGLETVFKPYHAEIMRFIWEHGKNGVTSREAEDHLKTYHDKKSRAAVIFTLNEMVDDDVLSYEEETCKGGHRKRYYPKLNKKQFEIRLVNIVLQSLLSEFPEATNYRMNLKR